MAAKPTKRDDAEDKVSNLSRYKLGSFGPDATKSLGINVVYQTTEEAGITVNSFAVDSPAKKADLAEFDWILEVDQSPVGFIRGRYYEPWQKYGRSGQDTTELLVSYMEPSGERKYYYPNVSTQTVTGEKYCRLPDDFFTVAKPRSRSSPEGMTQNKARYVVGYSNFNKYARFEIGVGVEYSNTFGAHITGVAPGKAADRAGLQKGDLILEVDGAPVGEFNGRVYEIWRQYVFSLTGEVELLVAIPIGGGQYKYYYPTVQLDVRAVPT